MFYVKRRMRNKCVGLRSGSPQSFPAKKQTMPRARSTKISRRKPIKRVSAGRWGDCGCLAAF